MDKKELTKDSLYFEASEMGFYLENYACTEITFGFVARGNLNKRELQQRVFNLCLKYGAIKEIKFTNNHAIVRFESVS